MQDSQEQVEDGFGEAKTFVEGLDFYFDDGLMVLTRRYLLDRGHCCGSGCRHCPFKGVDTGTLE